MRKAMATKINEGSEVTIPLRNLISMIALQQLVYGFISV